MWDSTLKLPGPIRAIFHPALVAEASDDSTYRCCMVWRGWGPWGLRDAFFLFNRGMERRIGNSLGWILLA